MRAPSRRARGASAGKTVALHRDAKQDAGLAAVCILSALSGADRNSDAPNALARAYAGGLILAEAVHDLSLLRRMLAAALKSD